jgi:hypothetical protein
MPTKVTMNSTVLLDITPWSYVMSTDVSEERTAFIFRVEENAKQSSDCFCFLISFFA